MGAERDGVRVGRGEGLRVNWFEVSLVQGVTGSRVHLSTGSPVRHCAVAGSHCAARELLSCILGERLSHRSFCHLALTEFG